MIFRLNRFLLDPSPVEGGTPPPVPAPIVADPTAGYQAALKKYGDDASAFARQSYADAEALRRENAELRGKLPKAGSTILDADDSAAWAELTAIGKPSEIKARVDSGDLAVKEASGFRRAKLLADAAATLGWDADVLAQLPGVDALEIEVKEGQRNGRMVPVAEILTRSTDAQGKEVIARRPLEKHGEKEWAKFLPSLKAAVGPHRQGGTPSTGRPGFTPTPATRPATAGSITLGAGNAPPRRHDF